MMRNPLAVLPVLARYNGAPFAWGSADCLCMAADCVAAATGADPLGRYRGTYRTPQGAQRVILRAGARDLAELVAHMAAEANLPEIDPRASAVGDFGISDQGAVAVRAPRAFVARNADGAIVICNVTRAWSAEPCLSK